MERNNMPEINVDAIMEKIREELSKKKAEKSLKGKPQASEARTWTFIKKAQHKLQEYPFYNVVYKIAFKFKKHISKYKDYASLEDLLKDNGEDFITHAYSGILKRIPDEAGFNLYVSQLKANKLNKLQILGILRYSKEGREQGVKIKGLFLRYFVNVSYRIPLFGYMLRVTTAIVQLPKIVTNIEQSQVYTDQQFAQVSKGLSAKADVQAVDIVKNELKDKADIQAVDEVKNGLTDKADVQAVHEVINQLGNKADVQAVDEVKNELKNKADVQVVGDIKNELSRKADANKVEENKLDILNQQRTITALLEQVKMKLPEQVTKGPAENIVKTESHILDALYVAFENQFRGARADIKERLKVYLPTVEKMKPDRAEASIVDIGCGRGEWLELLEENGYHAKGIDINRMMVQQCGELGLDATEADVIQYLREQKSDSLDIITGYHIVEHIPFTILIRLLDECFRTLKAGGMILFETPNPENLIVGACNFYVDPTHLHPLPPETLRFLARQRGFLNTEILKLHKIKEPDYTNQKFVDEVLYRMNMEQDFSIIGYKG